MKNLKQYYRELGKLVYAVSIADGIIQEEERSKLKELVLKEMAGNEPSSDSSGMNQAFYVDFEFENSADKHLDLVEALTSYSRFIQVNSEANDKMLLDRSVNLLESVANAYTREREKNIIEHVKNKIQEITK